MQKEILIGLLEAIIEKLKSPDCHLSADAIEQAIEQARKLNAPAQTNLTAYQVCKRFGGISERTLRNWVAQGFVSQPHQIQGCNSNFWFSDDVDKDRKRLKAYGYIK